MLSRGSSNDAEFMNTAAIPYDEWDRWNADRDRFFERAPDASRYASPDIDGTQELASYGRWVWDPSYGYVWVPNNVASDWAPYQNGRWDYLNYYGWSWTSYDPWGWAPYHYGNWYRGSLGWSWYPGAIGPRHYWRPAMVGFFGFGDPGFGVSLGFGYGNIGWVPLAPFERFRPSTARFSPISFFFNFSHNVVKGAVVDALLNAEPWRLTFNDLLTSVSTSDEQRASKTLLATTLMGYARANPHRIRGRLMPVIVYDPAAGRRAFSVAMQKLRE